MFIGQHDGLCPEAQLHSMSEWAGGFSTEKMVLMVLDIAFFAFPNWLPSFFI